MFMTYLYLKYRMQLWLSYLKRDKGNLKAVQRNVMCFTRCRNAFHTLWTGKSWTFLLGKEFEGIRQKSII